MHELLFGFNLGANKDCAMAEAVWGEKNQRSTEPEKRLTLSVRFLRNDHE
jgi:hypothetical protein